MVKISHKIRVKIRKNLHNLHHLPNRRHLNPRRDAMAVVATCIKIELKIVQHGVQHAENVTNPIIGKLCAVKSHEDPLKEGSLVSVPW